jgi:hypothetical protein
MIKIERKKGKPRKMGKLETIAGAKPPKQGNPSLISQHSKQRKPITLPKTGIKRDV